MPDKISIEEANRLYKQYTGHGTTSPEVYRAQYGHGDVDYSALMAEIQKEIGTSSGSGFNASSELENLYQDIKSNPVQQFKDITYPGMGTWSYKNGSWNFTESAEALAEKTSKKNMLGQFYTELTKPKEERLGDFASQYANIATEAASPGVIQSSVSKGIDPTEAIALMGSNAAKEGTLQAYNIDQNYLSQLSNIINQLESGLSTSKAQDLSLGNTATTNQQTTAALAQAEKFGLGDLLNSIANISSTAEQQALAKQKYEDSQTTAERERSSSLGKITDISNIIKSLFG